MSEGSIQLVKNRIAQTGRNVFDAAFDHAAGTVLTVQALFEIGRCLCGCVGIWHAECIISDLFF